VIVDDIRIFDIVVVSPLVLFIFPHDLNCFVSSLDPVRTHPPLSSLNDFLGSGSTAVFLEDIHGFDDVFVFPLVLFIFLFMKLNGGDPLPFHEVEPPSTSISL
jgi:hypothetical protein